MTVLEMCMVAGLTTRTSAYLQAMVINDIIPAHIILLWDDEKSMPGQLQNEAEDNQYFDLNIPIFDIIKENQIPYEVCETTDVNSELVSIALDKRPEKYVIYSGYGGAILKKDILDSVKRFLHIHSGKVPEYKGSTTIYYSILNEGKCFASAIFLEKKIDKGPLIKMKEFPMPSNGEIIDHIYDPFIRADLLVEILKDFVGKRRFDERLQEGRGESYYIIHPVLKHLAILSCELPGHK